MKNHLTVSLLGPFQAALCGEPIVEFRADSARALLAFLILDAGSPYRREVLGGLLWPEQTDPEALRNLRQALSRLRDAIGDREMTLPFLTITRKSIQFNASSDYWLDVTAFQHLVAASRDHQHSRLIACQPCMERLQNAAELYRGEFMAGFSFNSVLFEEWLVIQREKLHRQAMELFHTLAVHAEETRAYEEAQRYARRQIELEPWREEAHQQLMRALALSGQRSAALAQYDTCCQLLVTELGAEPSPQTTDLYREIWSGALDSKTARPVAVLLPHRGAHNLPPHTTPFVGRQSELGLIKKRLLDPACRLVTLVGEGGIGKTRLALEVAGQVVGEFAHGAWFVPLADVTVKQATAEQALLRLVSAIVDALDLTLGGAGEPLDQVLIYLKTKELLLVLDNVEHLSEVAANLVMELLRQVPGVIVLVTSREPLYLQAETVMRIEALPVPDGPDVAGAAGYSSVVLFSELAGRRLPAFALEGATLPDVIHVCRLVEGVPLAIELAAGWVDQVGPAQMARAIQDNLEILTSRMRDVPSRHRSIRAVFEGSWVQLSRVEQLVLAQASAFAGSFDRDAVANVIQVPGEEDKGIGLALRSLVGKSLLQRTAAGRYEMHNLLRRLAVEKAQDPEVVCDLGHPGAVRARYCTYYMTFLQRQEPYLMGEGQAQSLASISAEIDNLRDVWTCAIDDGQAAQLARGMESLFQFYYMRSWFQEGEWAFRRLVESWQREATGERLCVWGKALACQGWFAFQLGRYDEAKELVQQSVSVLQAEGAQAELAFGLSYAGAVALHLGAYATAMQRCEEALEICRRLDDRYGSAVALNILGQAAYMVGEYRQARQHCEASWSLAQHTGNLWGVAFSLDHLGQIAFAQGAYEEARDFFRQSVAMRREIKDQRGVGLSLNALGNTELVLGEHAEARRLYAGALSIFQEIGHPLGVVQSLSNLGRVAWLLGEEDHARDLLREALGVARGSAVVPGALEALLGMAEVLAQSDREEQALVLASFVVAHAASSQRAKARAAELSLDLIARLPGEVAARAQVRGRTSALELLLEEIWS